MSRAAGVPGRDEQRHQLVEESHQLVEKRRPLVVSDELIPAEIPAWISLTRDEAFDVLEGLEAASERAWNTLDVDRAVTYGRLVAVIRRALGAEE